jgi:hypothetical protein
MPAGFFFVRRTCFDFPVESKADRSSRRKSGAAIIDGRPPLSPSDFSHHEKLFAKVKRCRRAQARPVPF